MQPDYHPGLATPELIVEVRRLLATERQTERLICRYLADLADRVREGLDNALWGYADELHAARCIFGLGVRDTRERVRIGRALRELPRVEAAFISGEVSYSRVREVTRVAEPSTETEWLELALTLDTRALERRVAAARTGAAARAGAASQVNETTHAGSTTAKPARTEWLTQNTVRVTFELSAETWGLLERALEGARRCGNTQRTGDTERCGKRTGNANRARNTGATTTDGGTTGTGGTMGDTDGGTMADADTAGASTMGDADTAGASTMGDADALAAVARDALAAQHQDRDASDPRCSVVVYECESCGKSELDTGVGPLELEPASAAALCCGRSEVQLETEGRVVKRGGPLPAALRRAVMLRDRCRCRVPGCNRRRYVDVHHVVARSEGGPHSRSNCLVLCTTHHHLLHDGKLEVSGDPEGELCFRHAEDRSLIVEGCLAELPTDSDDSMMPQGGSSSHSPAARLLHAIGRRGGWSLDALIEKLELPAHVVASALTQLELGGSIRYRDFAYHPI